MKLCSFDEWVGGMGIGEGALFTAYGGGVAGSRRLVAN